MNILIRNGKNDLKKNYCFEIGNVAVDAELKSTHYWCIDDLLYYCAFFAARFFWIVDYIFTFNVEQTKNVLWQEMRV